MNYDVYISHHVYVSGTLEHSSLYEFANIGINIYYHYD